MKIGIIDLGINNVNSVKYALQKLSTKLDIRIISNATQLIEFAETRILFIPGVGNFGAASSKMTSRGLKDAIHNVSNQNCVVVGICLGMQLLGNSSNESPNSEGMGLIEGEVIRLSDKDGTVPNVGWRKNLSQKKGSEWWQVSQEEEFYFTHSYFFDCSSKENVLAVSSHGSQMFPSIIGRDRIFGFQFHVEKSGKPGLALLNRLLHSC